MPELRDRIGNALASGARTNRKGSAATRRQKRRLDSAQVREDRACELYAAGRSWREISETMGREFDMAAHEATVRRIIMRGLERRAADNPVSVEAARQMLLERYEALFRAHMPVAIGMVTDDGLPDVRSAELVLKVLDQIGTITGAKKAPATPLPAGNTFNIFAPDDADTARAAVMAMLTQEREKHDVIDGHLAAANTSLTALTGGPEDDDTMAPPPTQERAA
jgi:hypothetical protein